MDQPVYVNEPRGAARSGRDSRIALNSDRPVISISLHLLHASIPLCPSDVASPKHFEKSVESS
jgi:hypothetical protein